eukprot:scaffold301_cov243-Pinguiococcus_pyrenoidosus.AAC.157
MHVEYGASSCKGISVSPDEDKYSQRGRRRKPARGGPDRESAQAHSLLGTPDPNASPSPRRRLRRASRPKADEYEYYTSQKRRRRNGELRKKRKLQKIANGGRGASSESDSELWEKDAEKTSNAKTAKLPQIIEEDDSDSDEGVAWLGPQHDNMCFIRTKQEPLKLSDHRAAKAKVGASHILHTPSRWTNSSKSICDGTTQVRSFALQPRVLRRNLQRPGKKEEGGDHARSGERPNSAQGMAPGKENGGVPGFPKNTSTPRKTEPDAETPDARDASRENAEEEGRMQMMSPAVEMKKASGSPSGLDALQLLFG